MVNNDNNIEPHPHHQQRRSTPTFMMNTDHNDFSSLFVDSNVRANGVRHLQQQQQQQQHDNRHLQQQQQQQHEERLSQQQKQQQQQQLQQQLQLEEEEREELLNSFSPLSNMNSLAASPYPMSNDTKTGYSSLATSPCPSTSMSGYPLSNNPSDISFPMSNELKIEPSFNVATPSPSFNTNPSPSFNSLGDGDFSHFFNDPPPLSTLSHNNNNNNNVVSVGQSMSTELDLYRKSVLRKEAINNYLQSDLIILDEQSMPALVPVQPVVTNDLSLDVFPFDQVTTFLLTLSSASADKELEVPLLIHCRVFNSVK